MFIDTIMALWNRIWYGRLKKVFVMSFLFGVSTVLLVIMIGVPILSHSSPIARHVLQSVDTANKKEDALSSQPRLDGLGTPPPTPTILPALASPTPLPVLSAFVSMPQKPLEQVTEFPTPAVVIIAVRHTRVTRDAGSVVKHPSNLVARKDSKPTSTPSAAPIPTSVFKTPVVSTPTPELLPTPGMMPTTVPAESKTPTPQASPDVSGTVQPYPTLLPAMTTTPTAPDLSWMNF